MLSPAAEWDVISMEDVGPRRLALGYVAPLLLIPTAAIVVTLLWPDAETGWLQPGARLPEALLSASVFFTLSMAGVWLFAWFINWLAPRFRAAAGYSQAFKVSAYSITAAALAGLPAMVPAFQILALLASTYSLYLLFLGAPRLMRAPEAASLNYAILVTLAAVLLALLVGLATMFSTAPPAGVFNRVPGFAPPASRAAEGAPGNMPGWAGPDPGRGPLSPVRGGAARTVPADLRSMIPVRIMGLQRVSAGIEKKGIPGQRTIEVEAEYRDGRRRLSLQIIYSNTIAEALGFGGPATSEFDRQSADGYSLRRRIEDTIIVEEWDNASQTGGYGRLIKDRFYVRASGGGGINMRDLRQLVEMFGADALLRFEAET